MAGIYDTWNDPDGDLAERTTGTAEIRVKIDHRLVLVTIFIFALGVTSRY